MNQSVIWNNEYDPNMNMSAHVSKVIKSANYHLSNIEKIRKFRLDFCNGLLFGITDELLCRLQKVQNNAARVVSGQYKDSKIKH